MKKTFSILVFIYLLLTGPDSFGTENFPVVKIGETTPSLSAYVFGTGEQISGQQFQTDGILTYKDYQYTVYYNSNRNVCIARRKLPVGRWEEVVLSYRNTADDAHNVICMGICHNDGTIHLAYDHHNDDLHYCHSIAGSANDPENMLWEASSFSATTNVLDKAVPDVTYPRFISKPDGNLLFECRFRWSGYGDSYLREYDAATKKWTLVGRYVQGEDVSPDACAYINGMTYDSLGKLHVTWCWRDDFNGMSNHDFYYAYSEDHGRTWKDTNDEHKATTDYMDPVESHQTGNCLGQTKTSFMIEAIPYNRGYINQETQAIDSKGRIHAVNSHIPAGEPDDSNWNSSREKARLHHRFRKEDGTWVKQIITCNGNSVHSIRRVNLSFDSFDNAYIVATGVGVLTASPGDEYQTWTLLSEDGKTGVYSEPLVDRPLLREKGVLSFVHLSADRKIIVYDYLTNNPHTPDGTGLLAEYFSDEDFSQLIGSEVVSTPDQNSVPAGTKSIIWSGTFETLLGEKYTLYVNTAARTEMYVNDRLEGLVNEKQNAQEYAFTYELIPSHKNNIRIKSVSAEPITLSWSGENTSKEVIPSASLYPEQANDEASRSEPELPSLEGKVELDNVLLDQPITVNTTDKKIFPVTPFDPDGNYSVEVKARINAIEGRGMDVEARSRTGKGFRVSLDETTVNWTPSPANSETEKIAVMDNSGAFIYRFAVENDKVHMYCEKEYIGTKDLVYMHDIQADDTETAATETKGEEAIGEWSGTGLPTSYGWSSSESVAWGNVVGGVRFESVTHPVEGGGSFTGRLLTVRWDGSGYASTVYAYPVHLDAYTAYELSFLYEYWGSASTAQTITAGISTTRTAAGIYEQETFTTNDTANILRPGTLRFTSMEAGQYYITFTGSWAMSAIGNLSLKSVEYENKLVIGKNYNGGSADFEVHYVSYQDGAFAAADEDTYFPVPDLPGKEYLTVLLQPEITLNAGTGNKEVYELEFNPSGDYSVEISSTVSSAAGRGLDLEVRDEYGTGFRTALNTESFRWIAPFANNRQIESVTADKQIVRYAVQENKVHIYRNYEFVTTFPLQAVGKMNEDGTTEDFFAGRTKPENLYDELNAISNPDFKNDAHNEAPTGWTSDHTLGGSPNPRVQEKSQTTELAAYPDGKKAFMFRYDGNGGSYYSYAVRLEQDSWYEYSFDLITWGNNPNVSFDVVVAKTPDASGNVLFSQTLTTPSVNAVPERRAVRFKTEVSTDNDEKYYLIFKKIADAGTIGVTDLYLYKNEINNLLFGKNYTDGTLNVHIDYISIDYSGAFAPKIPATSLEETSSDKEIEVYVEDHTLTVKSNRMIQHVAVYDFLGRSYAQRNCKGTVCSLQLPQGIYVVKVYGEKEQMTTKVMVR